MRMRRSTGTAVLGVALLCGVALATSAAARPGRGHPDKLSMLERGVERLELDEATREAVARTIEEGRSASEGLREDARAAHERMRELLDAEAPDEAEVMAQADVLGALQTEQRKLELGTMVRVLALIGPDGRDALRQAHEDRKERYRGRHGCDDKDAGEEAL